MKGEGGGSRLGWTPDPGPAPPRPPAPGPFSSWWWWSFLVVVVVVVVVWGSSVPPSNMNGQYIQISWGGRFGPQPPPPPTIILYWIGSPQGPQIRQNRKPNTNTNIYLRYHHIGWGEVGGDVRRGSKKAEVEVLGPERCRLPRPQFCQRSAIDGRTPRRGNYKG